MSHYFEGRPIADHAHDRAPHPANRRAITSRVPESIAQRVVQKQGTASIAALRRAHCGGPPAWPTPPEVPRIAACEHARVQALQETTRKSGSPEGEDRPPPRRGPNTPVRWPRQGQAAGSPGLKDSRMEKILPA